MRLQDISAKIGKILKTKTGPPRGLPTIKEGVEPWGIVKRVG